MNKNSGFTLIEVIIVVAILAILATIAVPSYMESVRKSKRADAQGALLGLAGSMERYFTENNSYCSAAQQAGGADVGTCPAADDAATSDTGLPAFFGSTVPLDGGEAYYNLTIAGVVTIVTNDAGATFVTPAFGPNNYVLVATRTASMNGDTCGDFAITSTGLQGIINGTNSKPFSTCWR